MYQIVKNYLRWQLSKTGINELFVNPIFGVTGPFNDFAVFKPKGNFFFSIVNRIATVTDISSNFNTIITSNGSGSRFQWIGCTKHLSSGSNRLFPFPYHTYDRTAIITQHIRAQAKKNNDT